MRFCQAKAENAEKFFSRNEQKKACNKLVHHAFFPRRLTSLPLMLAFATLTLTFGTEEISFRVVANEWMQSYIDKIVERESSARGMQPDSVTCR
jgi:hypothetical protein